MWAVYPGLADRRFDLNLISLGYVTNLEWTCNQTSYLETSNQDHWTIVGEFTRKYQVVRAWLNSSRQHRLRIMAQWSRHWSSL